MPEADGLIKEGKGRLFLYLAILLYLCSALSIRLIPANISLFHSQVPAYLITSTIMTAGFCLHFIALTTSAYYRRYIWVLGAGLAFMAVLLGQDWLRLLS